MFTAKTKDHNGKTWVMGVVSGDGYDTEVDGMPPNDYPLGDPKVIPEGTYIDPNGDYQIAKTGAPPSGVKAYAEMEKYLREKYTLNGWANMMDANPILIELIKNEEYQNAVNRANYLANDDNSLVDSEDADKLREVTNV